MRLNNFRALLFPLFLNLLLGGCAALPRTPSTTDQGFLLKDVCDHYHILLQWDSMSQIVILKSNDIEARMLVGSNIVLLDGQEIRLSIPSHMRDSTIFVPSDFEQRVIALLTVVPSEKKRYPFLRFQKIVIDAGHGGKDPGAMGKTGVQEKTVVLDIAKRLKKFLQKSGLEVKMTRDTDEFISLQKRTEIASQLGADLFISIHANSSPSRGVYGVEVFSLKDLGDLEKNEPQRQVNQDFLFETFFMDRNHEELENIISDMLYTHKFVESQSLAEGIAELTSKFAKTKNRGPKQARFYVLRNTLIPAILVEVGFLSNSKEEKLLTTESHRERIAQGLAEGILDFSYVR